MKPEISIISITLAVKDIARSIAFYKGIGLEISLDEDSIVIELDNLNIEFCLLSKFNVATKQTDLYHNNSKTILRVIVDNNEEVDFKFEKAVKHGGLVLTKPKEEEDGLYKGFFKDPDGHIWGIISYYEYNRKIEWAYN